jgi:hypothetical protein
MDVATDVATDKLLDKVYPLTLQISSQSTSQQQSTFQQQPYQVYFDVSNTNETSSLSIIPLYVENSINTITECKRIWSKVEEVKYTPFEIIEVAGVADSTNLTNMTKKKILRKIRRHHKRKTYMYSEQTENEESIVPINIKMIIPILQNIPIKTTREPDKVRTSSLTRKLGTLFEVRYESRNDPKTFHNHNYTTYDRFIVRSLDGYKYSLENIHNGNGLYCGLGPFVEKIWTSHIDSHFSQQAGFTYDHVVVANTIGFHRPEHIPLQDGFECGVYISTNGHEIAVLEYNQTLKIMSYYIFQTRQFVHHHHHHHHLKPRQHIQPHDKHQFSYWPIHSKGYTISWTHEYWIVLFPSIDMICCYEVVSGLHISTIEYSKMIRLSIYEGLSAKNCKLAIWCLYYGEPVIIISSLTELLDKHPPLRFYKDILVSDEASSEKQSLLNYEHIQRIRKNHIHILKCLHSKYIKLKGACGQSYLDIQWLDKNHLVVQSIYFDVGEKQQKCRLFYIQLVEPVNKTDINIVADEDVDNNNSDEKKSETKSKRVDVVSRKVGTIMTTELDAKIQTKNCLLYREILLQLPEHDVQTMVKLHSLPSRYHIRFEMELLVNHVLSETELFQNHIHISELIVCIFQYLF